MATGLTIGSLFSGVGGLELGLEWAGFGPVAWQCELSPFCRAVLAKHWPTVTRFVDVTQPREYPHVDVICGGFPCQDVSSAGKRRGIGGARSGLWRYFARVVDQVRTLHRSAIERAPWGLPPETLGPPTVARACSSLPTLTAGTHSGNRGGAAEREWPTLTGADNLLSPSMAKWPAHAALRATMPTLTASDAEGKCSSRTWRDGTPSRLATLVARDAKGLNSQSRLGSKDLPAQLGGHLNPTWAEWFMGFPLGWTDVSAEVAFARSATPSCRSARKSRASRSGNGSKT